VPVTLEGPPERAVRVDLPEGLQGHAVVVRLGSQSRSDPDGDARFERVLPGSTTVEVSVGACPPEARGCLDAGPCPAGCASWTDEVAVPWGRDEWVVIAPVTAPEALRAPRPTAAAAPTTLAIVAPEPPAPVPAAPPAVAPAVTVGDYAAWLADHPEWLRDAAIAGGFADDGYLAGWSPGTAPAGTEGQAVRNVSWYAASAYCRNRGGLAPLDGEPQDWEESPGQPYLEWRVAGSRAAWRSGDGRSSTKVRLNEANSFTGFRCAR
jgi:hypothetical protein